MPVKADGREPENAFHRIENLQAFDPQAVRGKTVWESHTRAPFRLLSIRAPRQAVLRTSSGLAPSVLTSRLLTCRCERRAMHPTDFCHPNETACARTSCVPGSLSPLSRRGCPTESWAPYGVTGGQDVSRRPKTASADRHPTLTFVLLPHGLDTKRGCFLPTAWMRSSLWHPCRALSFIPAPLPSSRELHLHRLRPLLTGGYGSEDARECRDHP
jgi:hypothetical protein